MQTTTGALVAALRRLPTERRLTLRDSIDVGRGPAVVCLDTTGSRTLQGETGTPSVAFVLNWLRAWQSQPTTPVRLGDDLAREIGL